MLGRLMCMIILILLCGQMGLTSAGLAPGNQAIPSHHAIRPVYAWGLVLLVGPLHLAWLFQDRLVWRIYEAAYRRWPFGRKRCVRVRQPRPKGPKPNPPAPPKGEAVPEELAEMELDPREVDRWLAKELTLYFANYHSLFRRREQRAWAKLYLQGLMTDIPDNKSIESMMLALKGDDSNAIRAMQHFIGAGAWAGDTLLTRHWAKVDRILGAPDGVYILDGSEFLKQGQGSVGVKRQHCGEVGKIANCQAGVFLAYASQHGYTLLDRRLYLPREWVEDDTHAERREKCGVPDAIAFQTKPQLGQEMLTAVHTADTLRGRWLTCDEAFGRDTAFLDNIAQLGVWYYAEVPHDTRAWRQRPATAVPAWSGRGRQPTRERLVEGEPEAQDVVAIAEAWSADRWSRHTIKEGSQGPIVADFAALRVVAVRDSLPGPEVWLVLRRNIKTGELKTYLSNAPADTPFETLVQLSGLRWPIETCFEESKQHLGLGDYQVRSWRGWHHHMTLCILAHFFLVQLKLRLKANASAWTIPQVHLLIAAVIPKRTFDAQWALEVVTYRQERNHAASLSHRKRRLALLNQLE